MVCVVVSGKPIFGVIHRPFHQQTVAGLEGHGLISGNTTKDSESDVKDADSQVRLIIVSRSHAGAIQELASQAFPSVKVEPAGGSGYKTLRVSEDTAQLYLHMTAIKKWDICAGQAVIESVGGHMTTLEGEELTYFPDDSVVNEQGLVVARRNHFIYLKKLEPVLKKAAKAPLKT